jgi:hypothetical protein
MLVIGYAQREGIGKHIRSLAEVDALLADVRLVLGFVPFESHDRYARMIACFLDGAAAMVCSSCSIAATRRCCSDNGGTGTLIWRILLAFRLRMDIKTWIVQVSVTLETLHFEAIGLWIITHSP